MKKGKVIVSTEEGKRVEHTDYVVYSYDKDNFKFVFYFPELSGMAKQQALLILSGETLPRQRYTLEINDGKSEWVVPAELLGYEGHVKGYLHTSVNGHTDGDDDFMFTFLMRRSEKDKEVIELQNTYYDLFDDAVEQIQLKAESTQQRIQTMYSQAIETISATQDKIRSTDGTIDQELQEIYDDLRRYFSKSKSTMDHEVVKVVDRKVTAMSEIEQIIEELKDLAEMGVYSKTYINDMETKLQEADSLLTKAIEFLNTDLDNLETNLTETNLEVTATKDEVTLARGEATTLGERLDSDKTEVTTQLAQKANQSFVDSQFSSIVSGTPKGTYTNLNALQSAYPSGAEGIFLVIENGHWYYWQSTASQWTDGGVYQSDGIADGSVTTPKYADGSITNAKLGSQYNYVGVISSGSVDSILETGDYVLSGGVSGLPTQSVYLLKVSRLGGRFSQTLQPLSDASRIYYRLGDVTDVSNLNFEAPRIPPITPKSINSAHFTDDYSLNGQIADNTDLNSVIKDGNHFGLGDSGYTNLPPQFNPLRSFMLSVNNLTTRWTIQRLTDFSHPNERYVRRLDKTSTGTSDWVDDSNVADGSITRIKLGNNPLTNPTIPNNTDIFTIQKEGRYLAPGGASYNYTNVPEAFKNGNGVQKTLLLDVAVYGETGKFIIQTIYDIQNPSRCFYNYNQGTTNSGWYSVNGLPPNKTIVFFGDSITENADYPERVALKIGMRAINVGFGGCRMAQHAQSGNGLYYDKMCMHKLVDYIESGDFSELEQAAEELSSIDDNRPIVKRLINVDFNKVDIIVIGYGTNDYGGNTPIGTNDDTDGTTFKGAINKTVSTLLTKYPHIKIMFNTPFYRNRWESVNDGLNSDTYVNGAGHKLQDYVDALIEMGKLHHIPVFNLMDESGINRYNQSAYLADGLHPINPSGYEHLASKVASKIKATF